MRLKGLLSTDVINSGLPTSQTSINKIVTFYPVIFFEPIEKSRHLVYNKYRFYKGLLYFKKTKKKEIMQEYTYTETKIAKLDRLSSKSRKRLFRFIITNANDDSYVSKFKSDFVICDCSISNGSTI